MARSPAEIQADMALTRRVIERHIDQVTRMTRQQRNPRRRVQPLDHLLTDRRVVEDPMLLAHLLPDLVVLGGGQRLARRARE